MNEAPAGDRPAKTYRGGMRLEVTITHEAAAFAAMMALEGMSDEPVRADGILVSLPVPERRGAIMEAARRLARAGVAADDIVVRTATLDDGVVSRAPQVVAG